MQLLMEEIRKYDEAAGLDLQADFTPDKEQPALFLTTPNHTN